ncbi:unnamed protein product [Caenorhabditis auriculariae]|uniref:Uncharacterized protein n=1 Tax=Caenorhabditis auriculariae TaxID=2777116 RepID=A0A8S1GVH7_9PELO|nr:unnamed protein product [Caenorhabditis auriculariae]
MPTVPSVEERKAFRFCLELLAVAQINQPLSIISQHLQMFNRGLMSSTVEERRLMVQFSQEHAFFRDALDSYFIRTPGPNDTPTPRPRPTPRPEPRRRSKRIQAQKNVATRKSLPRKAKTSAKPNTGNGSRRAKK